MAERLCPICKRALLAGEAGARFEPFCSKRCADVDLGRWLTGSYAIPAAQAEDDEDDKSIADAPEDGENGPPN